MLRRAKAKAKARGQQLGTNLGNQRESRGEKDSGRVPTNLTDKRMGMRAVPISREAWELRELTPSAATRKAMISSLSWVRKGIAAQTPEKYKLTDEEYQRVSALVGAQVEEAKNMMQDENFDEGDIPDDDDDEDEETESADHNPDTVTDGGSHDKNDLSVYNLDKYDEEREEDLKRTDIPIFSNIKGLAYYGSNKEDPYVKFADEEEEAEELDELAIAPTDNLILAAKTEDDISHVEVYLYETGEDNLYVHHDILLPSFPLCVEWVGCRLGRKKEKDGFGNYVAIGSFETSVEIWDLDVIDAVYPEVILGERPKDMKVTKRNRANPDRHVDAVLSLAWNISAPAFLATGSADKTIKLWDLSAVPSALSASSSPTNNEASTTIKALRSFALHTSPVSALAWHPTVPTVLASGGHDSRIHVFDVREPQNAKYWNVGSDVECMTWDCSNSNSSKIIVGLEDGRVVCFDVGIGGHLVEDTMVEANGGRVTKKKDKKKKQQPQSTSMDTPLWTIHAHDGPASSVDVSSSVPGCLVTGGGDKMCKIWNIREGQNVSLIVSKDLGIGKVFSCRFCPDSPHLISAAGSKGRVIVWNLSDNFGMKRAFGAVATTPIPTDGAPPTPRKELTTIADDEEEEEDDDDDDEGDKEMANGDTTDGMEVDGDEENEADEESDV
ncbi:hypothetical protein SeLEV6574_g03014 [Synchytrium endobioticum]|nr:hypothetical protein SeLEV6574_g03014 [Synchytrium endobioticum]